MNRRVMLTVSLVVLVGLAGVLLYANQESKNITSSDTQNISQQTDSEDPREVVWAQLTPEQQEQIAWQDGKISKTTLAKGSTISDGNKLIKVKEYAKEEVYLIDFPTDRKAIPNNMIVYADTDTLTIIGYGLVD